MQIVCLGSGPSLTPEDVALCRQSFTIAINSTVYAAPWAAVAYAADYPWWDHKDHLGLPWFTGQRVALAPFDSGKYPNVKIYGQGPVTGLCTDGIRLATGKHSGYSAINLAVELGATEIVLLGYDMQPQAGRHHHHAEPEDQRHPAYVAWLPYYDSLKEPLTALGVRVLNASRSSAIPSTTFPRVSLPEVLNATDIGSHTILRSRPLLT